MTTKQFQRTIEDFICDNCGTIVKGTGYTNHCPNCLYSKHVDNNPGDRKNTCNGLMKPISIIIKNRKYYISHQCVLCGTIRNNRVGDSDNLELVMELSTTIRNDPNSLKYRKGSK